MTYVAGAVFVGWTTCSSADPIHVLIALGGVLGKIDASAKHASDVCMTLIKALMDNCVDEGRTWKARKVRNDTKYSAASTVSMSVLTVMPASEMSSDTRVIHKRSQQTLKMPEKVAYCVLETELRNWEDSTLRQLKRKIILQLITKHLSPQDNRRGWRKCRVQRFLTFPPCKETEFMHFTYSS